MGTKPSSTRKVPSRSPPLRLFRVTVTWEIMTTYTGPSRYGKRTVIVSSPSLEEAEDFVRKNNVPAQVTFKELKVQTRDISNLMKEAAYHECP